MTRPVLRSLALPLVMFASACGGFDAKPIATPEAPKPIEGDLLLFPHADAESLLGREVTSRAGGGFHVAESRAPGCEVLVRRTKAQYRAVRETKIAQSASVGASFQQIVSLEAKFGRESQARLELENTEVLEADLRGACGKKVVAKVFVGHGRRLVFAASNASGSAKLSTPVGGVDPGGQSSKESTDEIAWTDDQAYAFSTRELDQGATGEDLAIDVKVPSIVVEGEELRATFSSPRRVWLVVYYVDSENKAEVLWPSNEEPSPHVEPGKQATLPSPMEQASGIKIRPALTRPGAIAREQLVVYAFADKRDFDLVKPASGASSAAGSAFTEELASKLRAVPASRWSRSVVGYQIQPRK